MIGGKFNKNHAEWQRVLDIFNEPVWGALFSSFY